MIVIIDFGAGNLQSVQNGFHRLGVPAQISDQPEAILKADKLVFPGQGHFGACVAQLKAKGLFDLIREMARVKPFLGICIGMQLLFEKSAEAEGVPGLGLLQGEVRRFSAGQKLPQIGWNQLESPDARLDGRFFYFANSYFCAPKDPNCVTASSHYGEPFPCVIQDGLLLATQFHPEKSGEEGMRFLNFFATGTLC